MSALPPPPDLRARVLAAVRAEPIPPRTDGAWRRTLPVAAGFAVTTAVSIAIGGPSFHGRPPGYVVILAGAWLIVGMAATWAGVGRGRSMLGRPSSWKLVVATLTPLALLGTGITAALLWPGTRSEPATLDKDLVCIEFTVIFALGPLLAFATLRRRSDPVAPRLTGAAIGAASGTWGAVAIEMHCHYASIAHIVFGHVLPVALVALLGAILGDRLVAIRAKNA